MIERLAQDLLQGFPEMSGLIPRNLLYMRDFTEAYPEWQNVQQSAVQILMTLTS
jgi:hypothetical protein